ncbi:lysine decarboxylase [Salmonella enterica subsp. enterica]|uniref:lysine decarboxylase n=2 Tax=Salmonella enterica TaxID=28901 RepID=A0A379SFJ0_SALER|nr:lysine decarboxylase [Salmonella enterica]EAA4188441.1 lysine decarboxylase LdcC [Salmonella enterica subsp. enterica serovar Mikawasima]EAC0381175.1 lysine decarboxylase LdcC [Salmonella enterica subsp. enterica serovar Potsdam]EBR8658005.1 lysine decarboxylase LdcC [Salmonella enterica subsp. enterica serovar Kottbus]EBS1713188.1 lysine decarboxylase [Salmonella enterica subsp. enterica serovar Vitkin]EBS5860751.1 lysine decarboxylase [Salmonella enterica subsp. enterica serovar Richmond]
MNSIAILNNTETFFKNQPLILLSDELAKYDIKFIFPEDVNDLLTILENNASLRGVIFDWDQYSLELCEKISQYNELMPMYAFTHQHTQLDIDFSQLKLNIHFFEYVIDGVNDTALKIKQITDIYIDKLLPPFTKALFQYVDEGKYTFCTPGHMGGTAFQKSPGGSIFYDFFGKNTMKSDLSVSVSELGSLLDHSGPHAEAEQYIAETFNAERSYIVTNGTSTANKIVGIYSAPAGCTILIDRNCHKSLTHLMMMSDVTPIYFRPTRNAYGILGGIPRSEFDKATIESRVKETPDASWPVHAVITNSTYDGLLYNTDYIKKNLDVKSIHFDSAWVPYTNFSPIYKGLCGMSGERVEGKVIYETQSTHKLLAAFSQASMIHVKGDINEETFNEAYMMHTSTSPHYGIVASTEMAAAMMKGNAGKRLFHESVERAFRFRKEMIRLKEQASGWFFDVWQPDNLSNIECWGLSASDSWHGFKDIDNGHMFLDPIKVTLLTPGMNADGTMAESGIPASIVAKYLDEHHIIVEKTGPYNLLFLFSIGIDKTKAMSLLRALTDFKRIYDQNLFIKEVLPSLYKESPEFYENMRIQELAQNIHSLIRHHNLPDLMYKAFDTLPQMVINPYKAFQKELHGEIMEVYLDDMLGKVNANMILPYPPGVPLVMPGEKLTEANRPILDFLQMLCEIGSHYPGFETDIHGAYKQADGRYTVKVLK